MVALLFERKKRMAPQRVAPKQVCVLSVNVFGCIVTMSDTLSLLHALCFKLKTLWRVPTFSSFHSHLPHTSFQLVTNNRKLWVSFEIFWKWS